MNENDGYLNLAMAICHEAIKQYIQSEEAIRRIKRKGYPPEVEKYYTRIYEAKKGYSEKFLTDGSFDFYSMGRLGIDGEEVLHMLRYNFSAMKRNLKKSSTAKE